MTQRNRYYRRRVVYGLLAVNTVFGAGLVAQDQGWTDEPATDTTLPPCTGQVGDAWDNCTPVPTTTTCQEDMPCWDCATMGNLVCGPITTTTTVPTVVSALPTYTG